MIKKKDRLFSGDKIIEIKKVSPKYAYAEGVKMLREPQQRKFTEEFCYKEVGGEKREFFLITPEIEREFSEKEEKSDLFFDIRQILKNSNSSNFSITALRQIYKILRKEDGYEQ